MKIIAFLPIKKKSVRVPNKNVKKFSNIMGGLTYIKLRQLVKVKEIYQIIVSSDDIRVEKLVAKLKNKKILFIHRPKKLSLETTSTDQLINYIPKIVKNNCHILWTHVTSPFVNSHQYKKIIKFYKKKPLNSSIVSVKEVKNFIWSKKKPLNYKIKKNKWPLTQSLTSLYEINNAVFLCPLNTYVKENNRISKKNYFYKMSFVESIDIDWKEDFTIAEILWKKYGSY